MAFWEYLNFKTKNHFKCNIVHKDKSEKKLLVREFSLSLYIDTQYTAQALHSGKIVHNMVPLFPTRSWPWVQTPVPPLCYRACLGALGAWVLRRTFGTNCKNPPKIIFEKFVKSSGHTCVCNNLTSFECEVHKNRKRKWCKSAENCFEKLVKSHQVNLFLAYFTHLKPQWAVAAAATPRSSSWPVTRGQTPNITYVFSDSNNWMAWKFACRTSGVDQMNPVWWHKEVNKKLLKVWIL